MLGTTTTLVVMKGEAVIMTNGGEGISWFKMHSEELRVLQDPA